MIVENIFTQTIAYETIDIDHDKILKFCYDSYHNDPEGRVLSNVGGWQSKEFFPPVEGLKELTDIIGTKVREYADLYSISKPLNIGNIWININRNGNLNALHDHPNSILAAVYYVKVPQDSGHIQFVTPVETYNQFVQPSYISEYNNLNSSTYNFYPQERQLVLFPSWLRHSVYPNETDTDRISIAMNWMMIKD